MRRSQGRTPRYALAATLAGSVLVLVLAACESDELPTVNQGATPTAVPTDPGATPPGSPPTQTDTEWGRIWDGLPVDFPTFPGASPTETGEGPASAILDAGDADPREVATFYQSALEIAGFSTLSLSGPREDGGFELESVGETTCRVRTTITPLGTSTFVTILYGADCPFE